MADRDRPPYQLLQVHPPQKVGLGPRGGVGEHGPSTTQVLAVLITLLPVTATLLALAGISLVGSLTGLFVTTPLFLLFSPVLVPAAVLLGLAVTGFLASGAMGLTGLASLSKVLNYVQEVAGRSVPEQVDYTKRKVRDVAAFAGQKAKEVGQAIETKAREGAQ